MEISTIQATDRMRIHEFAGRANMCQIQLRPPAIPWYKSTPDVVVLPRLIVTDTLKSPVPSIMKSNPVGSSRWHAMPVVLDVVWAGNPACSPLHVPRMFVLCCLLAPV